MNDLPVIKTTPNGIEFYPARTQWGRDNHISAYTVELIPWSEIDTPEGIARAVSTLRQKRWAHP